MKYFCLYEHFNENIDALIADKQLTSVTIPAETRNLPMYLYSIQLKKIIETNIELFLKEKQIDLLSNDALSILDQQIIKNFQIAHESSIESNILIKRTEKASERIPDSNYAKKDITINGKTFYYYIYGERKNNDNQIIFTVFTAYLIDHQIWNMIFQCMPDNCVFYVLDSTIPTPDVYQMIKLIYQTESITESIALCWCSGFKLLLKAVNSFPDAFQKIISVTGNYSDSSNIHSFSDYEKSLNTIASILIENETKVVDGIFSQMIDKFFLRSDQQTFWNIEQSIYKLVTNPFTSKELLLPYLKKTREYKDINVKESLNRVNIPLLNIIAVNDIVSLFDNNTIFDDYCGQAIHVTIPFASHWCIWTHAKQISQLINAFIEEVA